MGKEERLQQMVLGKPNVYIQKDEVGPPTSHRVQILTQNRSKA